MPKTSLTSDGSLPVRSSPCDFADYRDFLRAIVNGKRQENPSWTYGMWARQLDLKSSSLIAMILNGQRHPGPKLVRKMIVNLGLSGEEGQYFHDLVQLQKVEKDVRRRLEAVSAFRERHPEAELRRLDEKKFTVIANWYAYAIRELVNLPDFRENCQWISRRLGNAVAAPVVNRTIRDLIEVGLLERDRLGKLRYANGMVRTTDDITSTALQAYHAQILDRAKSSLSSVRVGFREVSGGCFPVSLSKLDAAKDLIRRFQHDLCRICESNAADQIYQIEVAFFPLTKSIEQPKQLQVKHVENTLS